MIGTLIIVEKCWCIEIARVQLCFFFLLLLCVWDKQSCMHLAAQQVHARPKLAILTALMAQQYRKDATPTYIVLLEYF